MSAVYYSYTVMSNLCEGLALGKGWMVGSFYRQFPTSSICNGKTYKLYLTLIHAMYVNGQVMKMALHMNRLKIIFKTIILSVT